MKRITAIILLITIMLTLCCCDNNKNNTSEITKPNENNNESTNQTEYSCTHLWGQWIEKIKATCQVKGTKERTCHNCNKTETEDIDILEHTAGAWVIDKVAEVGKDGHKYTKCVYCDKVMDEQRIPAITDNHQHTILEWLTTKTPDCTNNGTKSAVCSCGNIIKTQTIAATGHKTVVDNAVPATCKNTGLTEGKHCSACNKVIVAQVVVPKTDNHTSSGWIIDIEATCKAEGTRHQECTECGKILKSDTIEKRTEHTPMVKDVEIADGLFCGDDGEYFAVVKCKDCGEKISEGKYNLPERHSMVNDVCEICGLPQSTTTGLYFVLNPDKKSYYVTAKANAYLGGKTVIGVYNGLSVTEVGGFDLCRGVNSIVIGDCVKKIEAFQGCTNLKSVVIGNGVKEIPKEAFSDCTSLTTITIGDNVEKIGEKAFYKCNNLYYAYISGAHDWRCSNLYNSNVTIYGAWIGKEDQNEYFCAKYLKEYSTYEWTRK